MPHRSETLRVRGTEVHLLRAGRGDPLLVLHPEFASSRWFPFHDDLAARFHVVAPDHPGFGQSQRPEWLETVQDMAFFYLDLLDVLELAQVRVLGLSFGGWIAAELAVLAPERVRQLALVAAAGLRVEGVERFDLFAQPFEETLRHLFEDPERWIVLLPTEAGPEVLLRAYREATTLARLSWNPYLYDPKLPARLHRVRVPSLVLWGENDRFLPLPHGQRYAELLPLARLEVIPNCGHLPLIERREEALRVLLPFFQG